MKKIAICYSGQPRHIEESFPSHYATLIEPNKNYEVDIFAHIWNKESLEQNFFWPSAPERGEWGNNSIEIIQKTWNPKKIEFENSKTFYSKDMTPDLRFPHPVNNIFSMFYSMSRVSKLQQEYAINNNINYDYIIRIRTDLIFSNMIGIISDYDPNFVHIKYEASPHLSYAVNDHFAIGNQENMNIYFSAYENIRKMFEEKCAINPECLLGFNLKRKNIQINLQKWHLTLWRDL